MDNSLLMNDATWRGKFFSGGWQPGEAGTYDVVEKATGKVLSKVGHATPEDLGRAAQLAQEVQPKWASMPNEERSAIFRRAAMLIDQKRDELAGWIIRETGSIRSKADMELRSSIIALNASTAMLGEPQGLVLPSSPGRLSYAHRMPHGVVGVISPFNFPLILTMRAVAPALATGNAVIVKPDPQTAVSGGVLFARVFEEAGLPPGVLQILPGGADVGEAICIDPRIAMVAFTGSTAAGRRVGALCGQHLKKVSLELGGKNSLIVLEDADLDLAASNAAFGAWSHQGQVCMAAGRILASEKIAAELIERLTEKANQLKVGDPTDEQVALGPIINQRQIQRVHAIVQDSVAAGAKLHAGGTYEGLFYRPTVLTGVRAGMPAYDDEVFGPVASVTSFATDDEAVGLANHTDYGLVAAVISRSVGRAMAIGHRLRTGLLHINDQTVLSDGAIPFGGRGASGNGSRIGGPANWEEFTQWRWVTIKDTPPRYPF
jgi:benzaldehyde dehydrogenase (NAD)